MRVSGGKKSQRVQTLPVESTHCLPLAVGPPQLVISSGMLWTWQRRQALSADASDWNWLDRVCLLVLQG